MHWVRHPSLKIALALALALVSASAAALGLGQIEVKSRIGQPLLAEIPIISSDPAELEELRAGLASPETFARIGLPAPQGTVAALQFQPALDNAGRPVIRVTSTAPVNEPLLTFLVEVDWGQGRLVREYSALLDTPRTVSAPVQPSITAPVIAAPNVIERPVPPAPVVAAPIPPPTTPVPAPVAEPRRPDNSIATAPPRPVAPPIDAAPAPMAASQYGPVKSGESLSQIVGQLDNAGGLSLEQSMIALLRANPDAFIAGNINQLKQGAVLRLPPPSETADVDAREAMALVRGQVRQWRQARTTASPQPAAGVDSASVASRTPPIPTAAVPRREASARLEIVPPGASRATRAGTQSGISAGGEGQMLRQELQQTKESLAARDAELRELKGRVADLEKLQADQQQLLALKDSDLAAAQQRLAASNQNPAAPAPAPTPADSSAAVPTESPPQSILPWVLGGVGVLVVVLLLGAWLMRRRAKPTPGFRPPAATTTSLADAFGRAPAKTQAAADVPLSSPQSALADAMAPPVRNTTSAPGPRSRSAKASKPASSTPAPAELATAAAAHRAPQPLPHARAEVTPAPAWHNGAAKSSTPAGPSAASAVSPAAAAAEPSVGERLELAQAYLDLGDHDSARQLLREVAASGDQSARQRASRMLRELE